MSRRCRFRADFKARVAVDAFRGDKTIQEIASNHKVHVNQVSKWKRQALDGLSDVLPTVPIARPRTTTPRSMISTPRSAS